MVSVGLSGQGLDHFAIYEEEQDCDWDKKRCPPAKVDII